MSSSESRPRERCCTSPRVRPQPCTQHHALAGPGRPVRRLRMRTPPPCTAAPGPRRLHRAGLGPRGRGYRLQPRRGTAQGPGSRTRSPRGPARVAHTWAPRRPQQLRFELGAWVRGARQYRPRLERIDGPAWRRAPSAWIAGRRLRAASRGSGDCLARSRAAAITAGYRPASSSRTLGQHFCSTEVLREDKPRMRSVPGVARNGGGTRPANINQSRGVCPSV